MANSKKWSDYLKANSWKVGVPSEILASISILKLRNNEGYQVIMNNGNIIRQWSNDTIKVADLTQKSGMD